MKARRKIVETDLFVDIFFANIIRGENGDTPHIGDNDNWWIGNTDTGVKARGEDGKDGAGAIPEIGDNDNWWIGGVDTGISVHVQSDWSQNDPLKPDFIKNKPEIPSSLADFSDMQWKRYVFTNNVSNAGKTFYIVFTLFVNKGLQLYDFKISFPVDVSDVSWDENQSGIEIYQGADGPLWSSLNGDIGINYFGPMFSDQGAANQTRTISLSITETGIYLCGRRSDCNRIYGTRRVIDICGYSKLNNFNFNNYSKWER